MTTEHWTRGRLCELDGCERKHHARGLCLKHYRQQRGAAQRGALPPKPPKPVCAVRDCEVPLVQGHDFCKNHLGREAKTGLARYAPVLRRPSVPSCRIGGCAEPCRYSASLCADHFHAIRHSRTCVAEDRGGLCGEPARARGRCRKHEDDAFRDVAPGVADRLLETIAGHVVVTDEGCWELDGIGSKDEDGYVNVAMSMTGSWKAHRLTFVALQGPVEDETLDHLCQNPGCCNPAHLLPESVADNIGLAAKRRERPDEDWLGWGLGCVNPSMELMRWADRHSLPLGLERRRMT